MAASVTRPPSSTTPMRWQSNLSASIAIGMSLFLACSLGLLRIRVSPVAHARVFLLVVGGLGAVELLASSLAEEHPSEVASSSLAWSALLLMQRVGKDEETTPLSGDRPFFTVVLCKTHVEKPYLLIIPTHFQRWLPARRTAVVLRCRESSWIMSYYGHTKLKNLAAGWADFAIDNRLQVGDACVFELVSGHAEDGEGEVVLEVQVLRGGGLPEPEDMATKGDTADEPMAIMY